MDRDRDLLEAIPYRSQIIPGYNRAVPHLQYTASCAPLNGGF